MVCGYRSDGDGGGAAVLRIAAGTISGVLPQPWVSAFLAQNGSRACVVVFLFSLLGRLALLPIEPFPSPNIHDEFSYLLASDTFAHGRLANPPPPVWHHFEHRFYVLMQPTFALLKYGMAQALFMAFGQRWLFTPRAGILLSMALAAASLCWMLQAYLPAEWALLGGLLAVVRISWFSYFGDSYWGGAVAVLGGCLLMGAAARLVRKWRTRDGVVMALGLLLLANSRPWEGALLSLPICVHTIWVLLRKRVGVLIWLPGATLLLAGAVFTGYYFHRLTGRLTFPWVAYWQRWSICPPFLFGKPNYSVHYQFLDQVSYFRDVEMIPYVSSKTASDRVAEVIVKGINEWRFFVFPVLTLTMIGLALTLRARKFSVPYGCVGGVACRRFSHRDMASGPLRCGSLRHHLSRRMQWASCHACWEPATRSVAQNCRAHTGYAVVTAFLVRLIVIPMNTLPSNSAPHPSDITVYEAINGIMEAKPGRQPRLFAIAATILGGTARTAVMAMTYLPGSQHVIWARDTEPGESNLPLLCAFKDRQIWLLIPPEQGFVRAPDRTVSWGIPLQQESFCRRIQRAAAERASEEA